MSDHYESLLVLMREAFEGKPVDADGTWFVEGQEALLETFRAVTAEQASSDFGRGISSIATHLEHTRYYLAQSNSWARGENPVADWPGSWRLQTVSAEEWTGLQHSLLADYQEYLSHLTRKPELDQDSATGAVANLAHAAFHLGAIRQLIKFL